MPHMLHVIKYAHVLICIYAGEGAQLFHGATTYVLQRYLYFRVSILIQLYLKYQ